MIYSLTRGLGQGSETWIANIDGGNAQLLINEPHHIITYARFSPDDRRIAFVRMIDSNVPFTVGELWAMNSDGSVQWQLGDADAGHGYEPAWSPDNTRVAYVVRENGDNRIADQRADRLISNVYVADLTTGTTYGITSFDNTRTEAPVWSPDGEQLAFAAIPSGGSSDIWLYMLGETDGQLIRATQNANTRYPSFASDR